MEPPGKKVSEATIMHGLRHRLFYTPTSRWLVPGLAALGVLLILSLLIVRGSAAHPAQLGEAVTLNFTVTVTGGTAPTDIVLWFCADAQTNGAGCQQMNGQENGPFSYQFATTSGTTYHHIVIEWTDGRLPNSSGPLPQPPTHTVCSYTDFQVKTTEPSSINCKLDFSPSAVTPSPSTSTTPQITPTDGPSTSPSSDTNTTLVTGLQVVIGVGLVLLVILLIILIFQRLGARGR